MDTTQVRELQLVYGTGRQKAAERLQLTVPRDAANMLMTRYPHLPYECFRVVCVDTKHRVIGVYEVSKGGLDQAAAHPRDVFTAALLARAAAVILTHNHPSGDPTPSQNDIALTTKLVQAGEILSIDVLDHVITAEDRYFSFKEAGRL